MKGVKTYLNTKDMLEHLDLGWRQVSYWRSQGIFTPELGDNKHTERDLAILRFLKLLIGDRKMSVESIKHLQQIQPKAWTFEQDDPDQDLEVGRYIDLTSGHMLSSQEVLAQTLSRLGAEASEAGLEGVKKWIELLALVLFEGYRNLHLKEPTVYRERREALIDRMRHIDSLARVEVKDRIPTDWERIEYAEAGIPEPYSFYREGRMIPALPDDPEREGDEGLEELEALAAEKEERLGEIGRREEIREAIAAADDDLEDIPF